MTFKKTYLFTFSVLSVLIISGIILTNGCKNNTETGYTLTGDVMVDGKNLVQINCTKCHELVPVNALQKNVWKHHALPSMAHYLGISTYMDGFYKGPKDTAGLTINEWQSIVSYYDKLAPDTILPAKKPSPLMNDWAGFTLKTPPHTKANSFTTMASVDPYNHKIYTSDQAIQQLTEWDNNFNGRKIATLPSTAVSAVFKKDATGANSAILSCIGEIERMDFPNGRVINFDLDSKDPKTNQTLIADVLARPVQTLEGDFNKDGLTDLVILGQGKKRGGVYLFNQNKDKSYTQFTITNQPGAVQAVVGDFNNDGWPDLMVLFGSADEGLWLYLNDHKGGFTSRNLLRFPPVYGSTSFQLADIDHDGKLDLIYTCGYNYHDSRIMKPYHGLYIFKNTGDWNFKQQWFYPVNGCTKAIVADFDGDGDLDIVTSAFFADLQHTPEESVIYFEQDKPFNFKPHAIPVSKYGRWFSMDVGDVNNDGKPDIILGNYSAGFKIQPGLTSFWDKNLPFIVLQNNFKK
jgi:FG-GAP-like repeat/FG-GAP repeat